MVDEKKCVIGGPIYDENYVLKPVEEEFIFPLGESTLEGSKCPACMYMVCVGCSPKKKSYFKSHLGRGVSYEQIARVWESTQQGKNTAKQETGQRIRNGLKKYLDEVKRINCVSCGKLHSEIEACVPPTPSIDTTSCKEFERASRKLEPNTTQKIAMARINLAARRVLVWFDSKIGQVRCADCDAVEGDLHISSCTALNEINRIVDKFS